MSTQCIFLQNSIVHNVTFVITSKSSSKHNLQTCNYYGYYIIVISKQEEDDNLDFTSTHCHSLYHKLKKYSEWVML